MCTSIANFRHRWKFDLLARINTAWIEEKWCWKELLPDSIQVKKQLNSRQGGRPRPRRTPGPSFAITRETRANGGAGPRTPLLCFAQVDIAVKGCELNLRTTAIDERVHGAIELDAIFSFAGAVLLHDRLPGR
jgi:hypothetical protein